MCASFPRVLRSAYRRRSWTVNRSTMPIRNSVPLRVRFSALATGGGNLYRTVSRDSAVSRYKRRFAETRTRVPFLARVFPARTAKTRRLGVPASAGCFQHCHHVPVLPAHRREQRRSSNPGLCWVFPASSSLRIPDSSVLSVPEDGVFSTSVGSTRPTPFRPQSYRAVFDSLCPSRSILHRVFVCTYRRYLYSSPRIPFSTPRSACK